MPNKYLDSVQLGRLITKIKSLVSTTVADYLPLSGGTMTGSILFNASSPSIIGNVTTGRISILSGSNIFDGSTLQLFGRNDSSYAGRFYLRASTKSSADSSGAEKSLVGSADGSLTWNGSDVITSAGGTMTGNILTSADWFAIRHTTNQKRMAFLGGSGDSGGAGFYAYGKDYDGSYAGAFSIQAHNGTSGVTIVGKPDGTLTWNSNNIITDNTVTANMTITSSFEQYSSGDTTNAIRAGNVVTVVGVLKPKSNIAAGNSTTMFTLPSGYRPTRTLRFIQQGSGVMRWLLEIESGGAVKISRYGTTSDSQIAAGQWLPISATFVTTNAWPS